MINESNLFTIENIKLSEMSHLHKLICISNCIKYYLNDYVKLYEYLTANYRISFRIPKGLPGFTEKAEKQ